MVRAHHREDHELYGRAYHQGLSQQSTESQRLLLLVVEVGFHEESDLQLPCVYAFRAFACEGGLPRVFYEGILLPFVYGNTLLLVVAGVSFRGETLLLVVAVADAVGALAALRATAYEEERLAAFVALLVLANVDNTLARHDVVAWVVFHVFVVLGSSVGELRLLPSRAAAAAYFSAFYYTPMSIREFPLVAFCST